MKKKVYIQPSVENTLLIGGSMVMAGSPNANLNFNPAPIPGGEGGD